MERTLHRKKQRTSAKAVLRLPDLEVAKSAVLNSIFCPDAHRFGTLAAPCGLRSSASACAALRVCGPLEKF